MKGLAAILALAAATVAAAAAAEAQVPVPNNGTGMPNQRPSSCDNDRGEPVCLDKMASYSMCLGPELQAKLSNAIAACWHDDPDNRQDDSDSDSSESDSDSESDEVSIADDSSSGSDEEEVDEVEVPSDRQRRPGKGKGKGKKGKGKGKRPGRKGGKGRKGRRPGNGKGKGSESSSSESSSSSSEEDIFDVVEFVRNDVEERTCVYRRMGWICGESGQVDMDAMRDDISTAFMNFDFDWKSALLTCEAVKFPMLCSLTERIQEDLDIHFPGADIDLDLVIHRLSPEDRHELGRLATPLGFFNCAMDAFHAGCKNTVEDMLLNAHVEQQPGR